MASLDGWLDDFGRLPVTGPEMEQTGFIGLTLGKQIAGCQHRNDQRRNP
jgi:hypothetical protein